MPRTKCTPKDNTPLRLGALIRVSTERQEKRGESLRTQHDQIAQSARSLGAVVVATYAGQEHGTAGWERKQLDQLLADARKAPRPWDGVIVADPSRWSRDNVASQNGLDSLRDHGVRFFVLTSEYDLYDPTHRLFLEITSTIGAFHARLQRQKSMINRIARARRGIPTVGSLPFGRLWDKDAEKWVLDPKKVAVAEDIARRYLAGERLPDLAQEYGMNHSGLCRILRRDLGDTWQVRFRAADLGIDEAVAMTVPRLLDARTIKAVGLRLKANRTYLHKPPVPKHTYLLAGHIFCAACGYTLVGEFGHGKRYYRHYHNPYQGQRPCPVRPRPWVSAPEIEAKVLKQLFDLVGNPSAIKRALTAAVPDAAKMQAEKTRLERELRKVASGRERLLGFIVKGTITDANAEKQLADLRDTEQELTRKLEALLAEWGDVPDEQAIEDFTGRWEKVGASIFCYDGYGFLTDGCNDEATWSRMWTDSTANGWDAARERRALVEAVFSQPCADGSPAGVYVSPTGEARRLPKRDWAWTIRGRLDFEAVLGAVKPRTGP
jgi:site-specific DNA recombinase